MNISFPLFDIAGIRARKAIEAAQERTEQARYRQVLQDLDGRLAQGQGRAGRRAPHSGEHARAT